MFQRRLNYRFILISLAIVCFLTVTGRFVHSRQIQRNAGNLKSRAEQAVIAGDKAKALSYYERYLLLRPKDSEAKRDYILLALEGVQARDRYSDLYRMLEQSLRDYPNDDPLRRKAVEVALALSKPSDAKFHLEELLKSDPKDANWLEQLGQCEQQLGKLSPAISRFEESLAVDPARVSIYPKLANLYRRTDRNDEADKIMNKMVAANPNSARALLARARYLREMGLLDAAAKDVSDVRARLAPDEQETLLASAEVALAKDDTKLARAEFEQGRKLFPSDLRFTVGVVRLDLAEGRKDVAIAALKAAIAETPTQPGDIWMLADLCITAGQTDEARTLIAKLSNLGSPTAVRYLEARLLIDQQRWLPATELLIQCRPELSQLPDLAFQVEMLLAAAYAEMDQHDKRLESAKASVNLEPTSINALRAVADAKLANGNLAEGIDDYLRLAGRSMKCRFAAVRLLILQNRSRSQANWTTAEQVLEATPSEGRATAEFQLLKAQLLQSQGKRVEAGNILAAAQKAAPQELVFWLARAEWEQIENGPKAGRAILDEVEKLLGDSIDLRLARVANLATERAPLEQLKNLEAKTDGYSEADKVRLLMGLVNAYTFCGFDAETRRLLNELCIRQPNNLAFHARRVDYLTSQENPAELAASIETLRKLEGDDGVVWRYADALHQAIISQRDGTPAALLLARSRLAEIAPRRPNWSRIPLLEATLDDRAGKIDSAIEKYRRAIQLGARGTATVKRAVELLMSRRRFDEARDLLTDAMASSDQSARDFGQLATKLSIERQEPQIASYSLAAAAVPENSNNAGDQLWRGITLASLNKWDEAEVALRKAVNLAPTEAANWTALVQFLILRQKKDEALQITKQVETKVAPDQRVACLARCYSALGDRETASRYYEALNQQSPNDTNVMRELCEFYLRFGEADRAERLLRVMKERADGSVWARRALAVVLATKKDYVKGTEALELLEANLRDFPGSPEDQRVKAIVLAGRPGGKRLSIQAWEAASTRLRPTPNEEFLLAQLYESDGNWPKAKEIYLSLVAKNAPGNTLYLQRFCFGLLRMKEYDLAAPWLAQLEAIPNQGATSQTTELKARLAKAQNQPNRALELLKEFAEKDFQKRKQPSIFWKTGQLLAELGLFAEGESLVKRFVTSVEAKNPIVYAELADFYAQNGKTIAALDALELATARNANPERIGTVAVAIVRLNELTGAELQRIDSLLTAAKKSHPNSVDLLISEADVLDARGDHNQAIAHYRTILRTAPRTALVLNNLAWLLSLHAKEQAEALIVVEQAIAIAGPLDIYLDTRGVIQMRSGRYNLALRDITDALTQTPRADFEFHLALVHEAAGNPIEANRWLKKATQSGLTLRELHRLERADYERLARVLTD